MRRPDRCLTIAALVSLLMPGAVQAQDSLPEVRSSLGFRAGYAATPGEWNKSRVVPSVTLYGGGLTLEGDLEFRIASRWTLAIGGGYTALDGSGWEEYVRQGGQTVEVSAWVGHAEVLLRPHIVLGENDLLRPELGPAMLFAGGSESFAGREYTYDELPDHAFGGMLGLEYVHVIGKVFALSLRASFLLFPGALTYLDGVERTVMLFPVTAGVRLLF